MAHININQSDRTLSVAISGKFSFEDSSSFRPLITTINDQNIAAVNVDLSSLDMIDSSSLGILIMLRKRCEETGASLTLMHPSGTIKKIFELSKFYDLFHIVE